MFWYANLLVTQLPVVYAVTVTARRSIHQPLVAVTLLVGLAGPYDSNFGSPDVQLGAAVWTLALILTFVLARFWLHRRDTNARVAEEEGLRRELEERARIARELHDVVAHHRSIIAVQASTAPHRLDPGRPDVVDEFRSIGASARASLQELRQLLDVLRGTVPAATLGLADLPKLAESARLAGVPVRLIMNADRHARTCDGCRRKSADRPDRRRRIPRRGQASLPCGGATVGGTGLQFEAPRGPEFAVSGSSKCDSVTLSRKPGLPRFPADLQLRHRVRSGSHSIQRISRRGAPDRVLPADGRLGALAGAVDLPGADRPAVRPALADTARLAPVAPPGARWPRPPRRVPSPESSRTGAESRVSCTTWSLTRDRP